MDDRLAYDIKETAELLGLAQSTVRLMIETGQLKSLRVGVGKGKILIPKMALDDLLAGRVA